MGGRVAGKPQVLPALTDDLVNDGRGNPHAAEAADGEVIPVVNKTGNGIRHRG